MIQYKKKCLRVGNIQYIMCKLWKQSLVLITFTTTMTLYFFHNAKCNNKPDTIDIDICTKSHSLSSLYYIMSG